MCYHYAIPELALLEKQFRVPRALSMTFPQTYHVSGFTQPKLPVITNESPPQIRLFHWGLIPFWVKDHKTADQIRRRTINARAETIHQKPSFRHLINRKRCLVLANGFFEWRHFHGQKYPYYIQLKSHRPFAFAGLWDQWTDSVIARPTDTFTIITIHANSLLAEIHNQRKRMPVILHQKDEKHWINPTLPTPKIDALLTPFESTLMEAHPVSKLITTRSSNTNSPQVIAPVEYENLPSLSQGLDQYL